MKNIMLLKEIPKILIITLVLASCHKKEQTTKTEIQENTLETTKRDQAKAIRWRSYYSWLNNKDGC